MFRKSRRVHNFVSPSRGVLWIQRGLLLGLHGDAIYLDLRLDRRRPSRQPNLDRTGSQRAEARSVVPLASLRARMAEEPEPGSSAAHP